MIFTLSHILFCHVQHTNNYGSGYVHALLFTMEVAVSAVLKAFGCDIMQHGVNAAVGFFDKLGFDNDVTGRQRRIQEISQSSMLEYKGRGQEVNIMVWNMSLPNEHHFEGLVQQFVVMMGKGGGFCVEVFTGEGHFVNHGGQGSDNWRGEGIYAVEENLMIFKPMSGDISVWGRHN